MTSSPSARHPVLSHGPILYTLPEEDLWTAIGVSPDGRFFYVKLQNVFRCIDLETSEEVWSQTFSYGYSHIAVSPDGQLVALAINSHLLILSTRDGEVMESRSFEGYTIRWLGFTPSNSLYLKVDSYCFMKLNEELKIVSHDSENPEVFTGDFHFSPPSLPTPKAGDRGLLLTGNIYQELFLYSLSAPISRKENPGQEKTKTKIDLRLSSHLLACQLSPKDDRLVVVTSREIIGLSLDSSMTHTEIYRVPALEYSHYVHFSPSGTRLYQLNYNSLILREASTGEVISHQKWESQVKYFCHTSEKIYYVTTENQSLHCLDLK